MVISIHALREEGDICPIPVVCLNRISIHALREEGDWPQRCRQRSSSYFYPRPPRGGRLSALGHIADTSTRFLSTPSARRATDEVRLIDGNALISIHALREEGDSSKSRTMLTGWIFLSTPSARRATQANHHHLQPVEYFYPRPPRGGRRAADAYRRQYHDFYPRPPRGGRHLLQVGDVLILEFLSTPSARRATIP